MTLLMSQAYVQLHIEEEDRKIFFDDKMQVFCKNMVEQLRKVVKKLKEQDSKRRSRANSIRKLKKKEEMMKK